MIHHSVFDGHSVQVLQQRLNCCEKTDDATKAIMQGHFSARDYAFWESSQTWEKERWKQILHGVGPKFLCPSGAGGSRGETVWRSTISLDHHLVTQLKSFCQKRGLSLFAAGLFLTFKVLRAYRDRPKDSPEERFALGVAYDVRPPGFENTVGMFVNTVLVPSPEHPATETIEALSKRWISDILPLARTPMDAVAETVKTECNVMLAFNVGLLGGEIKSLQREEKLQVGGEQQPKNFDVVFDRPVIMDEEAAEMELAAKLDLTFDWEDDYENNGWVINLESGVGDVWFGIEGVIRDEIRSLLGEPKLHEQVLEWGRGPV